MRKMNEKITTRIEEDTPPDSRERPDRGSTTNTPRWVKVFGIIFIVLVLLFVIMHLTGNSPFGHHGMQ